MRVTKLAVAILYMVSASYGGRVPYQTKTWDWPSYLLSLRGATTKPPAPAPTTTQHPTPAPTTTHPTPAPTTTTHPTPAPTTTQSPTPAPTSGTANPVDKLPALWDFFDDNNLAKSYNWA